MHTSESAPRPRLRIPGRQFKTRTLRAFRLSYTYLGSVNSEFLLHLFIFCHARAGYRTDGVVTETGIANCPRNRASTEVWGEPVTITFTP